jgi:hypothetical protein
VEIRSHIFLTTALHVRGYIHVPTILPIGKAAVYKARENVLYNARENVPQGKSADKKEESDPLPLALNLQLPHQSFCS